MSATTCIQLSKAKEMLFAGDVNVSPEVAKEVVKM